VGKVIISCAITGAMHTPSMSDALPVTLAQIAEQSIAAAKSGAAITHLDARRPRSEQRTDCSVRQVSDGRCSPQAATKYAS